MSPRWFCGWLAPSIGGRGFKPNQLNKKTWTLQYNVSTISMAHLGVRVTWRTVD